MKSLVKIRDLQKVRVHPVLGSLLEAWAKGESKHWPEAPDLTPIELLEFESTHPSTAHILSDQEFDYTFLTHDGKANRVNRSEWIEIFRREWPAWEREHYWPELIRQGATDLPRIKIKDILRVEAGKLRKGFYSIPKWDPEQYFYDTLRDKSILTNGRYYWANHFFPELCPLTKDVELSDEEHQEDLERIAELWRAREHELWPRFFGEDSCNNAPAEQVEEPVLEPLVPLDQVQVTIAMDLTTEPASEKPVTAWELLQLSKLTGGHGYRKQHMGIGSASDKDYLAETRVDELGQTVLEVLEDKQFRDIVATSLVSAIDTAFYRQYKPLNTYKQREFLIQHWPKHEERVWRDKALEARKPAEPVPAEEFPSVAEIILEERVGTPIVTEEDLEFIEARVRADELVPVVEEVHHLTPGTMKRIREVLGDLVTGHELISTDAKREIVEVLQLLGPTGT